MSERSYQRNLELQVTGRHTDTCLLAAYDRISKRHEISTETYITYNELAYDQYEASQANPGLINNTLRQRYADMRVRFRKELGVETSKNIVETRVDTPEYLRQALSHLAIGGFRTAVYLELEGLHAVGVIQVDDEHYDIKSTKSPFPDEPVTVDDIYGKLDRYQRTRRRPNARKTQKAVNIVALPPEPRW